MCSDIIDTLASSNCYTTSVKNTLEERLFSIGMKWRIAYGFLRILFGLVLLKIVGSPLVEVIRVLMNHELVEDPSDVLYNLIISTLTSHPVYITYFIASYFIFWGVIDVVLSYNLMKHRMWAFPASFILIGMFIVYEVVRFTHTHSFVLLLAIFVDIVIAWLIQREFKKLKMQPGS